MVPAVKSPVSQSGRGSSCRSEVPRVWAVQGGSSKPGPGLCGTAGPPTVLGGGAEEEGAEALCTGAAEKLPWKKCHLSWLS